MRRILSPLALCLAVPAWVAAAYRAATVRNLDAWYPTFEV
jgi:hypothetical protein